MHGHTQVANALLSRGCQTLVFDFRDFLTPAHWRAAAPPAPPIAPSPPPPPIPHSAPVLLLPAFPRAIRCSQTPDPAYRPLLPSQGRPQRPCRGAHRPGDSRRRPERHVHLRDLSAVRGGPQRPRGRRSVPHQGRRGPGRARAAPGGREGRLVAPVWDGVLGGAFLIAFRYLFVLCFFPPCRALSRRPSHVGIRYCDIADANSPPCLCDGGIRVPAASREPENSRQQKHRSSSPHALNPRLRLPSRRARAAASPSRSRWARMIASRSATPPLSTRPSPSQNRRATRR